MKCGLLGHKLGHSYSPQIHAHLGDYPYTLYEKEPEELENFLKTGDFTGINVTMPYKKSVIPYLDQLSSRAQQLGSVNTIVRRDGQLIGHNTDFFGFEAMLDDAKLNVTGKKVLVLGSGGASNTAVSVLRDRGARVIVISRSGEHNYGNLHSHSDASVIVNTTPVGMYPNTGISPVDLSHFPSLDGVLDVIYNPARTQLLLDAEKRHIPAVNGLLMLVAQAKESSEWFQNAPITDERIHTIHTLLRRQMENIVLIGMPGSGKSTVGRLVAQQCCKTFQDADEVIVRMAGKSIPAIFSEDGEKIFRQWETQALAELSKQSGLVIATGGGCVTRPENYDLLHQNGTVFWLKRNIEDLPTDGRPLSQTNKLSDMYAVRKPLYHRFADHIIRNDGGLSDTVAQIMEAIK